MTSRTLSQIKFPTTSPGTERHLKVVEYGTRGSRPKVYLQAALHADEIPPLLVLNHLIARLDAADRTNQIHGHVVVVPVANPIGLGQFVNGQLLGRYALDGSGNFNRHYEDIITAVNDRVAESLGSDAETNVGLIRRAMLELMEAMTPTDETDFLRVALMRLAVDADIVLDLHSDSEALLHLYIGNPLWPSARDLSDQLGSCATLLAASSGGNPFDEAVGGIWWALAERFPDKPIPAACLSATVELRGESDVSEEMASSDANNLYRFLQRRHALAGDAGPLPEPRCEATPLEGTDMIRAPKAGVVSYVRHPGDVVNAGDVVAVVVDPLGDDEQTARTAVTARAGGLLFARRRERFARPGQVLCKVAGREPLPDRVGGALLNDR